MLVWTRTFLPYIYDWMRGLLLDNGSRRKRRRKDGESGESSDDREAPRKDLVRQVLDRSRDLCLAVQEKELFRETSYLKLYKNYGRHLNKQQLAALAGLYAWRDRTARDRDESCGYILPKHLLLRLAEELPSDVRKLQTIVRGQSPVVTARVADVIEVLRAAREQASGAGVAAFDPALWEGADVIPDFLTSDDEDSSDLLEALAREGMNSDAESGGGRALESPKSPNEGQGAVEGLGIKRAIGQSALGDPRKSAVGPSLLSVEDEMGVEEEEEPEAAPGAPRGGLEATARKAVVVKRAAGSALFGRPAKKANVAKGIEEKAAAVRETSGVREGIASEGVGPSLERTGPETVNADVRDETVRGESAIGSQAPHSSAAAIVGLSEGGRAESGRNSGVPTAGSTENGKVGFAEPGLKQKKRKGGLGAMFGARSSRGCSEETSAKAAAERVKASLALPFTPVGGLGPTQGLETEDHTREGVRSKALHEGEAGNGGKEENGAVPLEEVMMYEDGEEDEEEQPNGGPEEAERKPDPEAEKLALFGTQDLPKPISQAYRKTGASAQAANRESGSGGREAAKGKKAQGPKTSEAKDEQKSVFEGVGEGNDNGKTGSQHGGGRALPPGPGASALEAGCEGLAKDGKFDFAAAAGALGLRSFLSSKPAAGTKERGAKPAKQNRGSKPEEQSYGAQREEPGQNFNPFASIDGGGGGGDQGG